MQGSSLAGDEVEVLARKERWGRSGSQGANSHQTQLAPPADSSRNTSSGPGLVRRSPLGPRRPESGDTYLRRISLVRDP